MIQTILIPTDLRITSLNTLKIALEHYEGPATKVILLYSEHLSDSISSLLFYSPDKILAARTSDAFKEALEILKNRFEYKLASISIKLFHGYNKRALNTFLEAQQVTRVFIPETYHLSTQGRSFDPIPLLKDATVPVIAIPWSFEQGQTEQDQLISLFN